jgi:molybdopterin converting factor subunit 1
MSVTVLLFASYADALGASSLALDLPANATVADVLAELRTRPGAERLPPSPLVAVNQRYASATSAVRAGDEVAVIPPVAGG